MTFLITSETTYVITPSKGMFRVDMKNGEPCFDEVKRIPAGAKVINGIDVGFKVPECLT